MSTPKRIINPVSKTKLTPRRTPRCTPRPNTPRKSLRISRRDSRRTLRKLTIARSDSSSLGKKDPPKELTEDNVPNVTQEIDMIQI